jgi:hypothetical protein
LEWTFDSECEEEESKPVAFNGNGGARKQPYRHKTNRGSMFENDRKTKDTQPDFTGSIDVNGTIYWLHAWKEMTQSGKKRLSVSVQVQEERSMEEQRQQPAPARRANSW